MNGKYAVVVVHKGRLDFLAFRRTSFGIEKKYEQLVGSYPAAQIRVLVNGEWVRCDGC